MYIQRTIVFTTNFTHKNFEIDFERFTFCTKVDNGSEKFSNVDGQTVNRIS